MLLTSRRVEIESPAHNVGLLAYCAQRTHGPQPASSIIRFAITRLGGPSRKHIRCEIITIDVDGSGSYQVPSSIFRMNKRACIRTNEFNVVLLIPTGTGCAIGGHAGDATPVARAIAECCDTLITHPNVVNASDINEMSSNTMYVEGSIIARMLMGQLGLERVRANRVLVIIDSGDGVDHVMYTEMAINAVNAARYTLGLDVPEIVVINTLQMVAKYSDAGYASGTIKGAQGVLDAIQSAPAHDAIAIASIITVPHTFHTEYYEDCSQMINPWGGVEAMLTHTISCMRHVPTAHAPVYESSAIANIHVGVVHPRKAAEVVSLAFLHCVLKGLHRSPRIVWKDVEHGGWMEHTISAENIGCLVIPDGCLGIPTLAALEQGIPVIAVRENISAMACNDLTTLPWAPGQFTRVENYWEAIGVLTAMKAGVLPSTMRNEGETKAKILASVRYTNYAPAPAPVAIPTPEPTTVVAGSEKGGPVLAPATPASAHAPAPEAKVS